MLRLVEVASGLSSPVDLTSPDGDPRLFVVEQAGRIRVIRDGVVAETPFLDIRDRVRAGGERGLLGLAFHPRYVENGRFFVDYTDAAGTVVERYRVSGDPDLADPASAFPVLRVAQPFANHNGGQVAFGPDGMLYAGLGDGGGAGDPLDQGQDVETLLGSILRIDVDSAEPYAIPPDNPFAAGGGRPEIWAYGLRNPWRFSFDTPTGRLYIGDVGQDRREEIDVAGAGDGGLNFGWPTTEGTLCFRPADCDPVGPAATGFWITTMMKGARSPAASCTVARPFRSWTATTSIRTSALDGSAPFGWKEPARWTRPTGVWAPQAA